MSRSWSCKPGRWDFLKEPEPSNFLAALASIQLCKDVAACDIQILSLTKRETINKPLKSAEYDVFSVNDFHCFM